MYKTAFLIGVVNINMKHIYIKMQMQGDFINNIKLYHLLFLQIMRRRKLYYQNVNKSMQIK